MGVRALCVAGTLAIALVATTSSASARTVAPSTPAAPSPIGARPIMSQLVEPPNASSPDLADHADLVALSASFENFGGFQIRETANGTTLVINLKRDATPPPSGPSANGVPGVRALEFDGGLNPIQPQAMQTVSELRSLYGLPADLTLQFVQTDYSIAELLGWYADLRYAVWVDDALTGAVFSDLNEADGYIDIGATDTPTAALELATLLDSYSIPPEAVRLQHAEHPTLTSTSVGIRPALAQPRTAADCSVADDGTITPSPPSSECTLRSSFDRIVGGIQIGISGGWCTLGFPLEIATSTNVLGPNASYQGFATNDHCTGGLDDNNTDLPQYNISQPAGPSTVGQEALSPYHQLAADGTGYNFLNSCALRELFYDLLRTSDPISVVTTTALPLADQGMLVCDYADAAYIDSTVSIARGLIAKPAILNTGTSSGRIASTVNGVLQNMDLLVVDTTSQASFRITGIKNAPVGTVVSKVGARTGLTTGKVTRTCVDVRVNYDTEIKDFPCVSQGDYFGWGGDSGSPVFAYAASGGTNVELVGLEFAGSSTCTAGSGSACIFGTSTSFLVPIDAVNRSLFTHADVPTTDWNALYQEPSFSDADLGQLENNLIDHAELLEDSAGLRARIYFPAEFAADGHKLRFICYLGDAVADGVLQASAAYGLYDLSQAVFAATATGLRYTELPLNDCVDYLGADTGFVVGFVLQAEHANTVTGRYVVGLALAPRVAFATLVVLINDIQLQAEFNGQSVFVVHETATDTVLNFTVSPTFQLGATQTLVIVPELELAAGTETNDLTLIDADTQTLTHNAPSASFKVLVHPDTHAEDLESFIVRVKGIHGGHTIVIVDDDFPVPTVVAGNLSLMEGETTTLTVSLPQGVVLEDLAGIGLGIGVVPTQPGGQASDYAVIPSTLRFTSGTRQTTLTLTAVQDQIVELDELFNLTAFQPLPSAITGTVSSPIQFTVVNDDTTTLKLTLEPERADYSEGETLTVTVTAAAVLERVISGTLSLLPDGATAGASLSDWQLPSNLEFILDATTPTQPFVLLAKADTLTESTERFELWATVAPGQPAISATRTVVLGDHVVLTLEPAQTTLIEGADLTVTVRLGASRLTAVTGTVSLTPHATSLGASSADWEDASLPFSVQVGDTTAVVEFKSVDDSLAEPVEQFVLSAQVSALSAARYLTASDQIVRVLDGCDRGEIGLNQTRGGFWNAGCASTTRDGSYSRYFGFSLPSATKTTVDLESQINTYLYLYAGSATTGTPIASDDNGGSGLNSRIVLDLGTGDYTIEATAFQSAQAGQFNLSLYAPASISLTLDKNTVAEGETLTVTVGLDKPLPQAITGTVVLRSDNPTTTDWHQKTFTNTLLTVSAGYYHTCGLRIDYTVECWGDDSLGQSSPPTGTFLAVSTGALHTCGLRDDNTAECWGDDYYGQLSTPTGTFSAVSAGALHTCGLRIDGTADCWGDNYWSQSSPPTGAFNTVSAGGYHTCGLRDDGTADCWGNNFFDQLSVPTGAFSAVSAGLLHTCGLRSDYTADCWGNDNDYGYDYGQSSPPTGTFNSVSSGAFHTCGLRDNNTVECWGDNRYGQLSAPTGTFLSINGGGHHTCALRYDGTAECWGANDNGQSTPFRFLPAASFTIESGATSTAVSFTPIDDGEVEADEEFVITVIESTPYWTTYSSSANRTVRVSDDCNRSEIGLNQTLGGVWNEGCASTTRGGSYSRYLGFSLPSAAKITVDLESQIDTYLYLRAGSATTGTPIAFDDDGGAGLNSRIVLDLGTGDYTIEATTFQSAQAGQFNLSLYTPASISLTPNKNTVVEGTDLTVTVGLDKPLPQAITGIVVLRSDSSTTTDWHQKTFTNTLLTVSAGYYHTCGLRIDYTAECWGRNDYGQSSPPAGTFNTVSAGAFHTCGLRDDNTAECWGYNDSSRLSAPTGTFNSVSAGLYHTCGLRYAGTADCWGDNFYNQLSAPTGAFNSISTGGYHTCGLRSDNTADCWGRNNYGQLSAPTGAFLAVSAGGDHTCGLRSDYTAECWGDNEYGQLSTPTGTFNTVSSGGFHTCGLRSDHTADCWGNNFYGQLSAPTGIFSAISAGGFHTCGLRTDGTVTCWGRDDYNQSTPFRFLPAASFTIESGATSATVSFTPIDDGEPEADEEFVITVIESTPYWTTYSSSADQTVRVTDTSGGGGGGGSGGGGGLPPPAPATKVKLGFTTTTTEYEEGGQAQISFGPQAALNTASAEITLRVRSTNLGVDDHDFTRELSFTFSGQTTATLTISFAADQILEADEQLVLEIVPTDTANYEGDTLELTVRDTTAIPKLTVTTIRGSVDEGGRLELELSTGGVTAQSGSGRSIVLGYATRDLTATAGDDYLALSGELNLDAGSARLSFTTNDDELVENTQTFKVVFNAVSNVGGVLADETLTITDNDKPNLTLEGVEHLVLDESGARNLRLVTYTVGADKQFEDGARSGRLVLAGGADSVANPHSRVAVAYTPQRLVPALTQGDYACYNGVLVTDGSLNLDCSFTLDSSAATQLITLVFSDDDVVEDNEVFRFILQPAVADSVAGVGTAKTVTVNDDDTATFSLCPNHRNLTAGDRSAIQLCSDKTIEKSDATAIEVLVEVLGVTQRVSIANLVAGEAHQLVLDLPPTSSENLSVNLTINHAQASVPAQSLTLPVETPEPTPPTTPTPSAGGLNVVLIGGGVLVAVLIVAILVAVMRRKSKPNAEDTAADSDEEPDTDAD